MNIFDLPLLDAHRARALSQPTDGADFLWQALADRLADRLEDVTRSFLLALELGSHHGALKPRLLGKHGIEQLIQLDRISTKTHQPDIVADGAYLPIQPNSVDLVVSIGQLQWVNDLPGCLLQINQLLKPDGLLLALIPGGDTLFELRTALDNVAMQRHGGMSPRISPMLGVQDAADLMQRAGFALPVVDVERIQVSYSSLIKLMADLRAMGQTNALIKRGNTPLTHGELAAVDAFYHQHFPHPEGGLSASFDIITLTGWKPHASQAQPLARGSGKLSMRDVLGSE